MKTIWKNIDFEPSYYIFHPKNDQKSHILNFVFMQLFNVTPVHRGASTTDRTTSLLPFEPIKSKIKGVVFSFCPFEVGKLDNFV